MTAATASDILARSSRLFGKPYLWGVKPPASDPNPPGTDCSGLVEWTVAGLGLPTLRGDVGGTWGIKAAVSAARALIPVDRAIRTPGALLGMDYPNEQHVAFSRGDGTTAEARGRMYGIGSWPSTGRPWNWAALVPGADYSSHPAPAPSEDAVQPDYSPALTLRPIVSSCPCPSGGAWLLLDDGGIANVGGAPFFGAPIADAKGENWKAGGRKPAHIEANGDGYVVVDTAGEHFAYGPR